MTRAASEIGISRQRGFWLRCFLGPSQLLLGLVLFGSTTANANVCVSETIHVFHLHGKVSDQLGEMIPKAHVTLKKDGNIVSESATDAEGYFSLQVASGDYDLLVNAPGFVHAGAPVKVGWGPKGWFRPNTLYVTLAVGSLSCPPNITTSHREFNRQIRAYRIELGEPKENHATQK